MDNIRHLQNERELENSVAVGKKTAQATNKTRVQVLAGWLRAFFLLAAGLAVLGLFHASWFYGPFGPDKRVSPFGFFAAFCLMSLLGFLAAWNVRQVSQNPTRGVSEDDDLAAVIAMMPFLVSGLMLVATQFAGLAVWHQDWPDVRQTGVWPKIVQWLDGSGHWRLFIITIAIYAISMVIPMCYASYRSRRSK